MYCFCEIKMGVGAQKEAPTAGKRLAVGALCAFAAFCAATVVLPSRIELLSKV